MKRAAPPVSTEVFVGREDGSFAWWLGLDGTTGNASFYLKGKDGLSPDVIEGVNVADAEWHHVVAVRDDSVNENRLYVDCLLQDSLGFDYLAGFDSTSAAFNIGCFNGDFYFEGVLDEVALYNIGHCHWLRSRNTTPVDWQGKGLTTLSLVTMTAAEAAEAVL